MSTDNKDDKIEIIPRDPSRRRERGEEWVYISFEDSANAFKALPLHKRIFYAMASLLGLLLIGAIVFLIFASVVLIWIPLLIATIFVVGGIAYFRARLFGR